MEKFNKIDALKYLVENSVYGDEWSGAGMYHAVENVIKSDDEFFTKDFLDSLLKDAANF